MKSSMKNAEFGQDFKMTVISLMKKRRIRTGFQNDGDVLNEKTPNSVISQRKIPEFKQNFEMVATSLTKKHRILIIA